MQRINGLRPEVHRAVQNWNGVYLRTDDLGNKEVIPQLAYSACLDLMKKYDWLWQVYDEEGICGTYGQSFITPVLEAIQTSSICIFRPRLAR
jgi:hypothetical protein